MILDEKQMLTLGIVTVLFLAFMLIAHLLDGHSLSTIKAKKVGDGQHGTARWATKKEIAHTFTSLPYEPEKWRKGENLPQMQGTIIGCRGKKHTTALVDEGDVHTLMIGAAGVGSALVRA